MHNHSYENEFNLHVNEISFSYERMSAKTRFVKEAKGNSEMAYYFELLLFQTSFHSPGVQLYILHTEIMRLSCL